MTQTSRARAPRTLVATLLGTALLLLMSACGMDAQTAQPYTPAEGVNANVGPAGEWVQVRNLMILSREDGTGYLSASIVAQERDAHDRRRGQAVHARRHRGHALHRDAARPGRARARTCWWC